MRSGLGLLCIIFLFMIGVYGLKILLFSRGRTFLNLRCGLFLLPVFNLNSNFLLTFLNYRLSFGCDLSLISWGGLILTSRWRWCSRLPPGFLLSLWIPKRLDLLFWFLFFNSLIGLLLNLFLFSSNGFMMRLFFAKLRIRAKKTSDWLFGIWHFLTLIRLGITWWLLLLLGCRKHGLIIDDTSAASLFKILQIKLHRLLEPHFFEYRAQAAH
jgi:hypothetical protein